MAVMEAGSAGFLGYFADLLGAPEPALRLLFSVLLGYPLALFHRRCLFGTDPVIQHLYFIITGITLGFYNYGFDMFHSILCVLVLYLILVTVGGRFCSVVISFLFYMGYLLIGYYYTGTDEYDIKWTMPHCVLTLRLIGLTWDVYDGMRPREQLSEEQKKTALERCPSLLEIAGHTYFFGGFMVGPQFPMKRYLDFVQGTFREKVFNGNPHCVTTGLKSLIQGIITLALQQLFSIYVPEKVFFSDKFSEYPFYWKLLIMGAWGKLVLHKYIAIWLIAEGSCILTGLTYNGTDANGKDEWDGCTNVKLFMFTFTTTFQGGIRSFNHNTNLWLSQYVYKRLKFLGNRHISQFGALLFLAAWHGLHSGYYFCFLNEFIVMHFERDFESFLTTRFPRLKEMLLNTKLEGPVRLFMKAYMDIIMGWCLVPFVFLSWSRYMQVYGSVYYIGYVIYFGWPLVVAPILRALIPKARVD